MKRLLFILAVAASVVAACSITSCKKGDTKNPLIGTWENVGMSGTALRKVDYTFTETSVNTYTYLDDKMVGGNGGTYTYTAPNVTITFTQPTKTETGSLNGEELTITTSDYGAMTFHKLEK